MTIIPRFLVLSLSQAKKKTTGNVRMLPTAARALASTREKPSDIMILGVYVVSGLQVAKTEAVARKCSHFRILVTTFHTSPRDNSRPMSSITHPVVVSDSWSATRSYDALRGRKIRSTRENATDHIPSTECCSNSKWEIENHGGLLKKIHCHPRRPPSPSILSSPAPSKGDIAVPPNIPKKNIAMRFVISSFVYHVESVNMAPGI